MSETFDGILYGLTNEIKVCLDKVPYEIKAKTDEIRLRQNSPLCLTVQGEIKYVTLSGGVRDFLSADTLYVTAKTVEECYFMLCGGSVFAHEKELKKGFIALKNGCRCGVGGVFSGGVPTKVYSLNIRIARQVKGSATELLKYYKGEGLLIAGPPASGKTTLLRDFVRQLSLGGAHAPRRVAVIDTRGELYGGGLDLGPNTDVINTSQKSTGVEMALRTLFPHIIAFDEIGTEEELSQVENSFFSGVSIITTAHIGKMSELNRRNITKRLLSSGVIGQVAVLSADVNEKINIFSTKEIMRFA